MESEPLGIPLPPISTCGASRSGGHSSSRCSGTYCSSGHWYCSSRCSWGQWFWWSLLFQVKFGLLGLVVTVSTGALGVCCCWCGGGVWLVGKSVVSLSLGELWVGEGWGIGPREQSSLVGNSLTHLKLQVQWKHIF